MRRYKRLVDESAKYDFSNRMEALRRYEAGENVASPVRPPGDPREGSWSLYLSSCSYYQDAVIGSHLGIDERPDPQGDLRRVVALTLEAFCGEWWRYFRHSPRRDRYPTPAHEIRSRYFEFWVTDYCYGVLSALALGDDNAAGQLGCYPGLDVITDPADRELERPDMVFHVILGSYLRYDCLQEVLEEWLRAVREGRSPRAKLWLTALLAIDRGKGDAFFKAFLVLAAHHRKQEYSARLRYGPKTLLMQEGGILWHLARRKGIAPAWESLPEEVSDHLLTIDTVMRIR